MRTRRHSETPEVFALTVISKVFTKVLGIARFGDPAVVADKVSFTATPPQIAASADVNGTLMYLINGSPDQQLVWYDRSGTDLGRAATTGAQGNGVSLSPDGKRVAFVRSDSQGLLSLWLQDLERNQESPLTRPSLSPNGAVVWSPQTPSDWSRDDRWLVYTENNPTTGADIWLLADPSKPSADRKTGEAARRIV